jgi:hypothetical protein
MWHLEKTNYYHHMEFRVLPSCFRAPVFSRSHAGSFSSSYFRARTFIYKKERKARTGQAEQDRQNRAGKTGTGRTGQAELDRQKRQAKLKSKTGQEQLDWLNRQAEQDRQKRTCRTG